LSFDFENLPNRLNTNCEKYDGLDKKFGYSDITPMWVADMDFVSPDFVSHTVLNRARHKVYGYPMFDKKYFESIINWQKRHGFEIKKDWICFSPSAVTSINLAINAFSNESDGIIIQPPIYPPFFGSIKNNSREVLENRLILRDNHYEIDFENLKKHKSAKAILLCNPHNPTGRVFTKEELYKIGDFALENNIVIISDEIHSDLVYKKFKHIAIGSIEKFSDIVVTINSASKTFNIAGLNNSYVIIKNRELRAKFLNISRRFSLAPNLFGAEVTKEAYLKGDIWLKSLIEYLESNSDLVNLFLKRHIPKIKLIKPEATYLLWLDFREFDLTHKEIENLLLTKVKVGFNSGLEFKSDEKFFRMNIATSKRRILKVLERVSEIFNKY